MEQWLRGTRPFLAGTGILSHLIPPHGLVVICSDSLGGMARGACLGTVNSKVQYDGGVDYRDI
jgi:hypothetical protein